MILPAQDAVQFTLLNYNVELADFAKGMVVLRIMLRQLLTSTTTLVRTSANWLVVGSQRSVFSPGSWEDQKLASLKTILRRATMSTTNRFSLGAFGPPVLCTLSYTDLQSVRETIGKRLLATSSRPAVGIALNAVARKELKARASSQPSSPAITSAVNVLLQTRGHACDFQPTMLVVQGCPCSAPRCVIRRMCPSCE